MYLASISRDVGRLRDSITVYNNCCGPQYGLLSPFSGVSMMAAVASLGFRRSLKEAVEYSYWNW